MEFQYQRNHHRPRDRRHHGPRLGIPKELLRPYEMELQRVSPKVHLLEGLLDLLKECVMDSKTPHLTDLLKVAL